MNNIVISGNLGNDPEIYFSEEGSPNFATFSLAFKSIKDKTCWIKAVAFNRTAEIVDQYLHKGAKICISGLMDENTWETDDGQRRSSLQLICNSIEFIKTDGRGFENSGNNSYR